MLQALDTLIAFIVILLIASLLVTILVQMLSAAFALRGKNLGNALALTFQSIDPNMSKESYALAERILSDPRLSHSTITRKRLDRPPPANQRYPWSWWSLFNGLQLTSAIRPKEIYNLLKDISEPTTTVKLTTDTENKRRNLTQNELSRLAQQLLDKLGRPAGDIETVNKDFSTLLTLADKVAPDDKTNLANAINTAQASFKAVSANMKAEVDELEKWFTAAQDRAEQWFQMHTRIFTIICGIVLAFLLQLDAAEIFKFVSSNATARAALAASADKLVDRTDGILEKSGSLLDRIYDTAKKKMPGIDLSKDVRATAVNSAALKKNIQEDTTHKVPADFGTQYAAAEKEAIDAYYKDRRAQMDDLTKGVAATGFNIVPNRLWHRWDSENGTSWDHFVSHFCGMLITAGLLSLGAPYWYNILKNLTNLRPAVSELIDQEKAAEKQTRQS